MRWRFETPKPERCVGGKGGTMRWRPAVGAIAMGYAREFGRDPRDERVLLVRDPERDGLVQEAGPLLRVRDQPSDLVGGRGEQCLGEPDALAGQLADDVERLMSLLGLQAVDREDDRIGPLIVPTQGFGVLLTRREHRLIALNVLGDAWLGQVNGEGVMQFGPDLGDRPVT